MAMQMAAKPLRITVSPSFFPSPLHPPPAFRLCRQPLRLSFPRAAAGDDPNPPEDPPAAAADADGAETADPAFDKKLAQVRLKYRSGVGKKAEQRRAKKSGGGGASGAASGGKKKGSVMLPPVPLREPVGAGGVPVEVGFTPYSERLNGSLAGLGLAALLLVELGSGKGLLHYHAAPTIFIQIYTVAAIGAVFVKVQKEKISVWPKNSPPSTPPVAGGE